MNDRFNQLEDSSRRQRATLVSLRALQLSALVLTAPLLNGCDSSGSDEQPTGAGAAVGIVGSGSSSGSDNGSGGALGTGGVTSSGASPGEDPTTPSAPTVAPPMVVTEEGNEIDCTALSRPPTPLRRLTRFEYNNVVRDLFATSTQPADEFPPDEIADGFSNNALVLTISPLHAERYMEAAETLAAEAVTDLNALLPCDPVAVGELVCAQSFAENFGRRAYRRGLEPEDISSLMAAYAVGDSFEKGIEVMIRAVLQSPNFIFRVEFTGSDVAGGGMVRLNGYETAARLSFLIWSSIPDDLLLDAAAAGELNTPDQVASAARRMLDDPKARAAVTEFYRQWLELNRLPTITKNVEAFPLWSDTMRLAMVEEGSAVVAEVLWSADPSLTRLLTAPLGRPSGVMAELYGVAESSTVVELPAGERSGILTLPGFMAVQAHPDQTSPVLRGKFVRTKLLCTDVPPPPDDVDPTPPDVSEGTARERFSAHAETPSCANCHQLMDPLGFPFESYDAMGQFRTSDEGREMDLSGEIVQAGELNGDFVDVLDLVQKLASSDQVGDCVTKQWFKYMIGRGNEDGDVCSLSPLQETFAADGGDLMDLIVSTTQTEAFLYRRASADEVSP